MKALIIDDERNILESVTMVLEYEGWEVLSADNGLDGLHLFRTQQPEVAILDVRLPGMNGLDLLQTMKEQYAGTEIIMISGHSGIQEAVEAARLGAFDFLEKPISRDKLLVTVRNAAEKAQLMAENRSLRQAGARKYRLVGSSPVMKNLLSTLRQVGKSQATVLIQGESGTGKELIARYLHEASPRHQQPFVQVNCAAIPDELIESELFGHVKGSFTGAIENKTGKFETAHQGTLFLDEVGDLSLRAQAKVLRALEEGEVQRVGTAEIRRVDVRVIAATNKNLQEAIREGSFREDLFYRLNVIPLSSPPLRERLEDIPELVSHFLDLFGTESNYRTRSFSPQALEALARHDWPGNIRELRNVVERTLILGKGQILTPEDLPEGFHHQDTLPLETNWLRFPDWKSFKAASETFFLKGKLDAYGHNVSLTARELGIPRSNLYKKLEACGILSSAEAGADEGSLPVETPGEESPGSFGKDGS